MLSGENMNLLSIRNAGFWHSGRLFALSRYTPLPPSPQRRLTRAWLIYSSLKMDIKKIWDDINRVILLNP